MTQAQTNTVTVSQDNYVRDGKYANSNGGATPRLYTRFSKEDWNQESYLKFNLSAITGVIQSAKLRVYFYSWAGTAGSTTLNALGCTDNSWTETTLKWSNRPAGALERLASVNMSGGPARWVEFDVTAFVQARLAIQQPWVNFALAQSGNRVDATLNFISKEGGANAPQLVIVTGAGSAYETAVSAVASSFQVGDAMGLISDTGLTAGANGSYTMNASSPWNSWTGPDAGYDKYPYVQFDLGIAKTIDRIHVWNGNEPGYTYRGFSRFTVQYSQNGTNWTSLPQAFRLAEAPGTAGYVGESFVLRTPVSARYFRLACDGNYGAPVSSLSKVRFHAGGTAGSLPVATATLPTDSGIINVKDAPYNAKGDGIWDDSDAIQRAINDWQGSRRTIYLPTGTYLVSKPLKLAVGALASSNGRTNIRGDGAGQTIIRLKDATFTNAAQPKAVLDAAYNGTEPDTNGVFSVSADWFNNNFGEFTVNIGTGNPGAIGVKFYANNVGSLRNVEIKSEDRNGVIGLDLGYAGLNGPLYVKNLSVNGFDTGIRLADTVNSITMENITLGGQKLVGIYNGGQCLSLLGLTAQLSVPVLDNSGFTTLVNATVTPWNGQTTTDPALINRATLFARNIQTSGFGMAIENNSGGSADVTTPTAVEFLSHPLLQQFGNRPTSLNLPVVATPQPPVDDPATWANVRNYRLTTDADDSDAVERAIASGASTLYFPGQGTYYLSRSVAVTGNVKRIVGMHAALIKANAAGGLSVQSGAQSTIWMEDFGNVGASISISNNSISTLVGRNLQDTPFVLTGSGTLFLENVATTPLNVSGQNVYARQLNIEGSLTKMNNTGGQLWVLGFKSEAGGTALNNQSGAVSEILGGLYYTQSGASSTPEFINNESKLSVSLSEVNFTGDKFQNLVVETRGGITRTLTANSAPLWVNGHQLPLYVGYDDPTYLTTPYAFQSSDGVTQITLGWDAMPRAISYTVSRSTSLNGTYTEIVSGLTDPGYIDATGVDGTRYYYKVNAVYASGSSADSSIMTAAVGNQYRIGTGSSVTNGAYLSDRFFSGGNAASLGGAFNVAGVTDPAPQAVYAYERWGNSTYTIPSLAPGKTYKVRLHFAETIVNSAGVRVFNVNINGVPALTNYDIYALAGSRKVIVQEFLADADAGGNIVIGFVSVAAAVKISAIEILVP